MIQLHALCSSDEKNTVYVHYGGECVVVKAGGQCPEFKKTRRIKAVQMGVPARYFTSKCRSGDIALVQLETVLPESDNSYDVACLPSHKIKLKSHNLTSAGYGYDRE
ncbi:hypothetical protein KIN20_005521 [Parelaphostrongylus tenuis]|uniref:Uncharacterized protein n=1 Tax=Parelaphostrongylus tenuis TaxID=148309 RepID=A0AAD5M4N3_PARTN|nr:hypothetical protein KIN20_005521 [Parelaphostrongylus tenuis]